jgi:hypothetical protein
VFWRNLNVFVGAFVLVATLASWVISIPVSLAAKLVLPARQAELFALPLAYAVLALGLVWQWRRSGLSPAHRRPERETRFRRGHVLLALFNVFVLIAIVATFVLPSLLAQVRAPAIGSLVMMSSALAPFAGVAGLIMVLTARAVDPQEDTFADTVPAGPMAAARSAAPAPARAKAPGSRVASAVPVVFGLAASGLLIFMGLVFASLSFQGQTGRFTGVVLPVAGACAVVYVTTTLWLLGQARTKAANMLAWAPVLLICVGGLLMQLGMVVFGLVLGRF